MTLNEVDLVCADARRKWVQDIRSFMGEYRDPLDEVREAVEKGHIGCIAFEALDRGGLRVGVAFAVKTGYERFQPPYHLAYLAVNPGMRGQGVGRMLVERITQKAEGGVSLHVSPKNVDAIRFYESLGWNTAYKRMTPMEGSRR